MSSRTRRSWRGGRGGSSSRNNPTRIKGLFNKGIWRCDCDPRLPADHFQVKKEGKNKGRWFYTCQNKQEEEGGCGFFLWDDDAKVREESAVLNNSKSEIDTRKTRVEAGGGRTSPAPPPSSAQSPVGKRQRSDAPNAQSVRNVDADATESELDYNMTSDEERLMAEVDMSSPSKIEPRTPGKRKFTEMNGAGSLPTPKTAGNLFTTPSKAGLSKESIDFLNIVSPATTPTPARFKDAIGTPSSLDSLYNDVMAALDSKNVYVGGEARATVREVCSLYSRRAKGSEKGKEITQLALKVRDAKIDELRSRIGTLEAELETERAVIRHLRWEEQGEEIE